MTQLAHHCARGRSANYGTALTFETLVEGESAPARMRSSEDTLLRVIAGIVRLTVGRDERLLGTGEETVIPAGAPHRVASAGAEARLVMGFRLTQR